MAWRRLSKSRHKPRVRDSSVVSLALISRVRLIHLPLRTVRRQGDFGEVGDKTSLVDKDIGFGEVKVSYKLLDKSKRGKVLFDSRR